jgi:hypothetical protein
MLRSTNRFAPTSWSSALLLGALVVGCGSSAPLDPSPTVPGTGTGTGGAGGHGPAPVVLGAAGTFVILAKTKTSNVPTSAITGNVGLSPAAASFITGFALSLPAGGAASTSSQVTGSVFASDYAVPTPVNLTTAISNMQTA